MHKFFFILSLIVCYHLPAYSQNDTMRYFINNNEKITTDPTLASSYVKLYKENISSSGWKIENFDKINNVLRYSGHTKDSLGTVKHGDFIYYSLKGVKSKQGKYEDGNREGEWKFWADDKLTGIYHYNKGLLTGTNQSWYVSGKKGDSIMLNDEGTGTALSFYETGRLRFKGQYTSGKKTGDFHYYYDNPENSKSMTVVYVNDKPIVTECFTISGKPQKEDCFLERDAAFATGDIGWRDYLVKKLSGGSWGKHIKNGNKYQVTITFIVDTDGSVSDVKPEVPGNEKLDALAMKMIINAPSWSPAIQYNQKVKFYFRQLFTFIAAD